MLPITDLKEIGFTGYDDDERDPSKFFIVYETGDNTTVAEGEAVPLDLFYSRATDWGDDYDLVGIREPEMARSSKALTGWSTTGMTSPARPPTPPTPAAPSTM